MALSIDFRPAQVDPSAFIAPGAVVLGDVTLGPFASVWFQAVIRGDTAPIHIGPSCNIQDGAILHADPGYPCTLGERVTVGHGAVVHGATIADDVLIGIRATVLNGVKIGPRSLIGAGALLPEGMEIPADSVVLGLPGKIVRQTTAADLARIRHAADHYIAAGAEYRQR